ncbi:hypothetical protein R3P38DRAFT_3285486 [Favolaschia claudopus]|uniref:Uncharacterized protein n=1 Tax=Favolaschia claudopus TaxID=2862362 RepID=A0AAW0A514_9AGAR
MDAEHIRDVKTFLSGTSDRLRKGILFPNGQPNWVPVLVPATTSGAHGPASVGFQFWFGLAPEVLHMPIDMAIYAPLEPSSGVRLPLAILHVDQNDRAGHPVCNSVNNLINEGASDASPWYGNVLVLLFAPETSSLESVPEWLHEYVAETAILREKHVQCSTIWTPSSCLEAPVVDLTCDVVVVLVCSVL